METQPAVMRIEPVVLTGCHVRLEPLTPAHADALWEQLRHAFEVSG